ncbi:hypothetical protein RB598_009073 [Gaeumannomyces tritici]
MSKGRVCLAYSGGLDTSTILVWLIEQGYTVVCFLADVGQEENWDEVRAKAKKLGAEEMVILDLQKEFVEQLVFRAVQCNAIYEDRYLLGTSLARPVIARAQEFTVEFEKGIPTKVTVDGKDTTGSVEVFKLLNRLGRDHGVGRIDIVENRFIGLKSRGCYDTPGLTIARLAHLDLEGLVMDSRVRELRDQFVTLSWSRQLYNGMYFSPEREFVENSIIFSQQNVTGQVRMAVYKGNAYVLGRKSDASNLYSEEDASMDSLEGFSPMDTTGFIEINAIRLKKYGLQKIKDGQPLTKSS